MKQWYLSRTIWVNALTLVTGTIGYLAAHELVADNSSLVAAMVALQGGVNIVLRFLTDKAIK